MDSERLIQWQLRQNSYGEEANSAALRLDRYLSAAVRGCIFVTCAVTEYGGQ
jgi:hypothetical protein